MNGGTMNGGAMKRGGALMRVAFAAGLFASQFTATRETFFSDSPWLLWGGAALIVSGVVMWLAASRHLQRATSAGTLAVSGPFRLIRHPIYASVYLLSAGLGLVFFAKAWFLVLAVFAPLWWRESVQEEQDLVALFGSDYEEYKARTHMYLPGVF